MSIKNTDLKGRSPYKCYRLNGVLFLPTYQDGGVYIGPNSKTRTYLATDLIRKGAEEVIELFWDTRLSGILYG